MGWEERMVMRVLDKIIRITEDGVEYEADQRHAEHVVKQLNLETPKVW